MTDKVKSEKMTNVSKPVPMKLFAAWEVDKTPPNCVPRLCTLTITHLTLCAPLPAGLSSVSLAARMHSSKRTLRSNEIPLPPNPLNLDTDLDLNFSLQYPHFVKRDGNRLQILLQRRKKYKNRTILGYKTIAEGIIRMDQVLQRSMDMELELCSESCGGKGEKGGERSGITGGGGSVPIAKIAVHQLSSTPVDHDNKNNNTLLIADRGYSDEEEEAEFSSVEDNDEGIMTSYNPNRPHRAMAYNKSDLSYTKLDHDRDMGYSNMDRDSYMGNKGAERDSDSDFENRQSKRKGGNRGKMAQRNLKQKFVALLKRFRVPEEMESGGNRNSNNLEGSREIDELFQELDSLSCGEDSGQELDTISISSTPKPSLRPFFASSRSLAHHDNQHQTAVARASVTGGTTPSIAHQQHHSNLQDKTIVMSPLAQDSSTQTVKDKRLGANNSSENDQWRRTVDRSLGGPDGTLLPYLDQDELSDNREQTANDQLSGSPPKEKDEKKSKLFRSAVSSGGSSSGGGRKKQQHQQHSLTIPMEQGLRPSQTEHSAQSPTNAENTQPRRSLLEMLSRLLGNEEGPPPEMMWLVYPPREGVVWRLPAHHLHHPTLHINNYHEVRAVMQALLNRICKYCNTSSKPMQTVRLVLVGPDALVSGALRAYVELWSLRPPDWGGHVRFYIIPLGVNNISRYLSSLDAGYSVLFGGDAFQAMCERAAEGSLSDATELSSRINRYINGSGPTIQLPVAEAMVAYREKSCDEDSTQIFVPFVNEVRIGSSENNQHSMDMEEMLSGGSPPAVPINSSGHPPRPSPPATPASAPVAPLLLAPASATPHQLADSTPLTPAANSHNQHNWEPLELQLDYWQIVKPDSQSKPEEISARRRIEGHLKGAVGGGSLGSNFNPQQSGAALGPSANRASLKSTFRCLQAARLTPGVDPHAAPGFHITYATKEKKQKIMRLGKKKEKDKESDSGRSQTLDNVSRLICSAKSSHVPLKVYIDGAEWSSVKFFQLSMQWQTHVKNFPIALLGAPLAPQELT